MADTYVYMNGKKIKAIDNSDGTYKLNVHASGVTLSGDIDVVQQGALTNRSGSITTGGTSQELAAANTARRYLLIQNLSVENLWVNFATAAVGDQPSIKLVPDATLVFEGTFVPTGACNIIGATTGSKFTAKEG